MQGNIKIQPIKSLYQIWFGSNCEIIREENLVKYNCPLYNIYAIELYARLNGKTDVIRYYKKGNEENASFYTFDNFGNLISFTLKDKKWRECNNIKPIIIPLFAAFRERKIAFNNGSINDLVDEFFYEREEIRNQAKRLRKKRDKRIRILEQLQ